MATDNLLSMPTRLLALLAALLVLASSCGDAAGDGGAGPTGSPPVGPGTTAPSTPPTVPPVTAPDAPLQGLGLQQIVGGLANPVLVTAPTGDDRLFVVEQPGRVRIVADGVMATEPFLDITADVGSTGLEQGLLGLAFHPGYAENGRFFVHYTDRDGDSRIVEFSGAGDRADIASGRELLRVDQPAGNHNGGMIEFGPDGYLYVALGDGGGANDQFGNGQRPDTLLGTLLRLDVDGAVPYAVPPDNPFLDGGGAPEVWAYGLRNPWRFSFDPAEGLVYVGDVGQARWEEIHVAPADAPGLNYGWSIVEGDECFAATPCDTSGLMDPAFVYDHGEGCSVIGGYVYRGAAIPELTGHYFYGDWCGEWVRSFRYTDGTATQHTDWDLGGRGQVLGFGRDAVGELYFATALGDVWKLVPKR